MMIMKNVINVKAVAIKSPLRIIVSTLLSVVATLLVLGFIGLAFVSCDAINDIVNDGNGTSSGVAYTCENGTAKTGTPSGSSNVGACQSCESGFKLNGTAGENGTTCVATQYTCANGTAKSGTPDGTADVELCEGCESGYTLLSTRCVQPYTCTNGTPADTDANADGSQKCATCKSGYTKTSDNRCVAENSVVYTCTNGTAKTGTPSGSSNVEFCEGCKSGYTLLSTRCVQPYTCTNGTPANTDANADGSQKCTACKSGYTLLNTRCVQPYTCTNGTPANTDANADGSQKCTACESGYTLLSTRCVQPYTCANGTPADTDANADGSQKCATCKSGYIKTSDNRCVAVSDTCAPSTSTRYRGHSLTWSDEFDASQLDTSVWRYDTDNQGNTVGWGNGEKQWYTGSSGDNVYLENGNLVIEAQHESQGSKAYTSGRVHTHGGQSFQYGLIEACIRQPTKKSDNSTPTASNWPAFWLLGDNFSGWGHTAYGGNTPWPQTGEIDVMEVLVNAPTPNGALHWANAANQHEHTNTNLRSDQISSSIYTNYHIYGIRWDSTTIEWYIDDTVFKTFDISHSTFDEFRESFFILLNLAINGAPNSANYPQKMYVDWVRHYQRSGLSFDKASYAFDIGKGCLRFYGDNNCGSPNADVAARSAIGSVTATTTTAGAPLTYTLSGSGSDTFAISSAGALTVGNTALSGLTADTTYTLTVTATDGSLSESTTVTITNVGETQQIEAGGRQQAGGALTITDETSGCYQGSATCIKSRYGGSFGGHYYRFTKDYDVSGFTSLHVAYNLESGANAFEVKLEDSDSGDETTLNNTALTGDGSWQILNIPLTSYPADVDRNKIHIIGFWNQGANKDMIIDEVFFR